LPLSAKAIEQAIEVTASPIKMNTQRSSSGDWRCRSRAAGCDDEGPRTRRRRRRTGCDVAQTSSPPQRVLTNYQNAALAERYRKLVTQVRDATSNGGFGDCIARAVAINYAKLLAYKDEYEVAALYRWQFRKTAFATVRRRLQVQVHLAPPLLAAAPTTAVRASALRCLDDAVFRLLAKMPLRAPHSTSSHSTADRRLERD